MKEIKCVQCNGTGNLDHFKHIQNGKCFTCDGKGILLITDEEFQILPKQKQIEHNYINYEDLQDNKIYKAEFPSIRKGIQLYFKVLQINNDEIEIWHMVIESLSKKIINDLRLGTNKRQKKDIKNIENINYTENLNRITNRIEYFLE